MEKLKQENLQSNFIEELRDKFEVVCLTMIFIIATSSITGDISWLG